MFAVFVQGDGEPRDLRVIFSGTNLSEARIKKIGSLSSPTEWNAEGL